MQFDETYNGYRIKYRKAGVLAAVIWPPNSGLALSEIPQASHEERHQVLVARVRKTIDEDIEKSK